MESARLNILTVIKIPHPYSLHCGIPNINGCMLLFWSRFHSCSRKYNPRLASMPSWRRHARRQYDFKWIMSRFKWQIITYVIQVVNACGASSELYLMCTQRSFASDKIVCVFTFTTMFIMIRAYIARQWHAGSQEVLCLRCKEPVSDAKNFFQKHDKAFKQYVLRNRYARYDTSSSARI